MKALSVQQPWAWAIVGGHKDVENRTWTTSYRGPLLIHAGKRMDGLALRAARALAGPFELTGQVPKDHHLLRGGIVGVVTLVDVVEDSDSRWAQPGHYHWLLRDAKAVLFQAVRGRLGLFDVEVGS